MNLIYVPCVTSPVRLAQTEAVSPVSRMATALLQLVSPTLWAQRQGNRLPPGCKSRCVDCGPEGNLHFGL